MENVFIVLIIVIGVALIVFLLRDTLRSLAINVVNKFGFHVTASPSTHGRRRRSKSYSRNIDNLRADSRNEINIREDSSQIIDTTLGRDNKINIGPDAPDPDLPLHKNEDSNPQ